LNIPLNHWTTVSLNTFAEKRTGKPEVRVYACPTVVYQSLYPGGGGGVYLVAQVGSSAVNEEHFEFDLKEKNLNAALNKLAEYGVDGLLKRWQGVKLVYFRFLECLARLPPMR
jgi:hypothetical protein